MPKTIGWVGQQIGLQNEYNNGNKCTKIGNLLGHIWIQQLQVFVADNS